VNEEILKLSLFPHLKVPKVNQYCSAVASCGSTGALLGEKLLPQRPVDETNRMRMFVGVFGT
ncbi:unnamed protein product, partial [Musa acuminata subsp. burmannicoides]